MSAKEEALSLLPTIYEAALAPNLWPSVLQGFSEVVRGNCTALIRQNAVSGLGQAITTGFDPAAMDDYFGYYATRNVLLPRLAYVPVPSIHSDQDAMPKAQFQRTEYFADFLNRRLDVTSVLLGVLWRDTRDVVAINFCRGDQAGDFDLEEKSALALLAPHLQRALLISLRVGSLEADAARDHDLLDRAPYALLVVDANGRVKFANALADALLSAGDGLAAGVDGLKAANRELTSALRALLVRAAAGDDGGAMALPRPIAGEPLYALVSPFARSQGWLRSPEPLVLVMLRDPNARRALSEAKLRSLFGLTAAEARLAAQLHRNGSLAAVAARLNISVNTARTHLNAVLDKTGTHRQAELARRLAGLEDLFADPTD